jgi:Polyketide cyclase / dehydrase and lipid transport
MRTWTTEMWLAGMPDQVLALLTEPGAIARWAPIAFEAPDLGGQRLCAGTRTRVRGVLAGRELEFAVDVREAGDGRLSLVATGPISIDAEYVLSPADGGSDVRASVSVGGRGLVGSVLARIAEGLLAAGALRQSVARMARELDPELAV